METIPIVKKHKAKTRYIDVDSDLPQYTKIMLTLKIKVK